MDENIKKRVTEDTITLDGRTFVIKKFDPLMGNYIIAALSANLLPLGLGNLISANLGVDIGNNKNSPVIDKKQFLELQRDILSVCYEVLSAGRAPVITENGGYGINDFTSNIAIQLIVATVAFNYKDFFDASPLKFLIKGQQT